jgi:imidazolonepropionase-like amidohydrolase
MTALALALLLAAAPSTSATDVAAARALFQKNLDAIAHRDKDAYLSCYLNAGTLARTGFEGPELGYEPLARSAGEQWPDTFEARDLRLVPLRAGVVYGTYRYRVRYGADERAGLSERVFLKTPAGWRIAVSTAFDAPASTPPAAHALVGATLVDGRGGPPVADAVVVVKEGRIDCAGPRAQCPLPGEGTVTDLRGQWITPGLVDAHVHFSQTGWADGRPDALDVRASFPYEKTVADLEAHPERFFRSQLCAGVTAVFDVGGYAWTTRLARRAREDARAPHVAAAGPLLSTLDHWLNMPAERQFMLLSDEKSAREGVRYLAALGSRAVKVWYIVTPQLPVEKSEAAVMAAGEEARQAGLPLIVHATGLAEAKVALRAGARLLVHGVSDLPLDDEFIALAREKGTIYCPTLTVVSGYVRLAEAAVAQRPPAVDDPHGCLDAATRARLAATASVGGAKVDPARAEARRQRMETGDRVGRANLQKVSAAGIPVAMGTDAGNPLTLHGVSVYAEMEAMQASGLTPMQVLVAATAGGARAMGMEKEIGTVEKGKVADLLVLAADPTADAAHFRQLRHVMRAGTLRGIEELAAVASAPPPKKD